MRRSNYTGPWKYHKQHNKKALELVTPEKINGKPKWPERRDLIMSVLDKYKRIVHNHRPTRKANNNIRISWDSDVIVSEKDFDRLIKMGWVKKQSGNRRNYYVRAIPKPEEIVQEPREPYKKRKMAIAELEQLIMNKRKGKQHERVPQSNNTTSVAG